MDAQVAAAKKELQGELNVLTGGLGATLSKDLKEVTSLDDLSKKTKAKAESQVQDYKDDAQKKVNAEKSRLNKEKEKAKAALKAELEKQKSAAKEQIKEEAAKKAKELLKSFF